MPSENTMVGLNNNEVLESRKQYGSNTFDLKEDRVFLNVLKEVVFEPMFLLLVVACSIYFILGQNREGFIMLISIFIVAGISFYQEYKSRNAINALKKFTSEKATVIRNGETIKIEADDIVVDDIVVLVEGVIITADGILVSSNDFSVNELILTGESLAVYKNSDDKHEVFKGTLVTSGLANFKVTAVGMDTRFSQIGLTLKNIKTEVTPLQLQIRSFVKNMAWFGAVAFLLVFAYNYYQSKSLTYGLLQGLTLAMSVLPEEIPVAFSAFMALGAYRLMRQNVIVKQPQFVETLGSATVICVDKTGTLTENRMEIAGIYDPVANADIKPDDLSADQLPIVEYAMWSSETNPFDPMEKAIFQLYERLSPVNKRSQYEQVHEYPLGGKPPFMTHIFENNDGDMIVACKGSPEAVLQQSGLNEKEKQQVLQHVSNYAQQGFRVLGVGKSDYKGHDYPQNQQELTFTFLGLVAFNDPPKPGIEKTIEIFKQAGLGVKMITGDFTETAIAIGKQIGLDGNGDSITGEEILKMDTAQLRQQVNKYSIFARMFPEAKLKVIEALKANGEVVAMTGDGVNDAPALKSAQIGVAMGLKGSEVAKGAASIILSDDNLFHMTEAIALGRKIYDNLQKAIQYIVSIHIPIILIVTLPLVLMWKFTDIFTPIHVIFMELIMGPTCSIIYENEQMEAGTMNRPPRKLTATFLSFKQLLISIVQGLFIAAGCLISGYVVMQHYDEATMRTVIFITLLFSNVFLTLVNRSFYYSVFTMLTYKNNLIWIIIGLTLLLIATVLYVPYAREIFYLVPLNFSLLLQCILVALVCTGWVEVYKIMRRMRKTKTHR